MSKHLGPVVACILAALAVALWLTPAVAQEHGPGSNPAHPAVDKPAAEGHAAEGHAAEGHGTEGGHSEHHGPQNADEYYAGIVNHTQDHKFDAAHTQVTMRNTKLDAEGLMTLTQHRLSMLISAGLVLLVFVILAAKNRTVKPVPRGSFEGFFDTLIVYIRDEIVRPNVHGHHADALLPLFVCFFFFILFCNLFGMIPGPVGMGTATANTSVTAALALTTFAVGLFGGMIVQGPIKFWVNLVPHGLPVFLIPIMFVIEVVGLCTKHFALAIRLFANMLAGHIVLGAIIGLIFLFKWVAVAPTVGLATGLSLLETFVAFLQAYVFTLLSALFIGMALHPDH